jgi:CRP-like cAMP-binding protein
MPKPFHVNDLNIPKTSEIHALLEKLRDIEPLVFGDGEYLIRQDEAVTDTFIVVSGNCVVEYSSAGPERRPLKTLAVSSGEVDSPSFVGEMAYLGGGFRTASVRSSGPTYTLKIKGKHIDVIIAEFPSLTRLLCKEFTARLEEANDILKDMAIDSKLIMKVAGETVIRKGEKADMLYQLVNGSLIQEDDHEAVDLDVAQNGFVDPGPFFRDSQYESTVKTVAPCSLVAIPKDFKLAVIRNYPELILNLYEKMFG